MKTTYLTEQIKKLIVSTALLTGLVVTMQIAHGGDRAGNGGSDDESMIASQQAVLEATSLKIKRFFELNETKLQAEFPEFKVQDLIAKIEQSKIQAIDTEELKDKYGKTRSCLNFPNLDLIECKYKDIKKLESDPKALFVLTLHEYLGLLGVEETSPQYVSSIDGYSISKRIAVYVTKVSDYDLKFSANAPEIYNSEDNLEGIYKLVGGDVTKCLLDIEISKGANFLAIYDLQEDRAEHMSFRIYETKCTTFDDFGLKNKICQDVTQSSFKEKHTTRENLIMNSITVDFKVNRGILNFSYKFSGIHFNTGRKTECTYRKRIQD